MNESLCKHVDGHQLSVSRIASSDSSNMREWRLARTRSAQDMAGLLDRWMLITSSAGSGGREVPIISIRITLGQGLHVVAMRSWGLDLGPAISPLSGDLHPSPKRMWPLAGYAL